MVAPQSFLFLANPFLERAYHLYAGDIGVDVQQLAGIKILQTQLLLFEHEGVFLEHIGGRDPGVRLARIFELCKG